ncbi:hypothetical protein [Actinomadura fibrosa]|uniref:Chaplin n=1 Tax=Actinomadura fibrosa TaxID=111802 RepID=A0ABW2XP54_9ACTN|nr:hypothetical protein [Actinomadura fibrosa]
MRKAAPLAVGAATLILGVLVAASPAQADAGGDTNTNSNTLLNVPIGLCGADANVLAIPVDLIPVGSEQTGTCVGQTQ